MHCHVAVFFYFFLFFSSVGCCFKFELFDVRFISPLLLFYSSVCDHNTTSSLGMKVFLLCFFFKARSIHNGRERTGQGFRLFRRNGTLSCTLPHQLGILPGQWDRGLRVLARTAHIYLIGVWLCVCVCLLALVDIHDTEKWKRSSSS